MHIIHSYFLRRLKQTKTGDPLSDNRLRKKREERLMSKAELARKAGVSPLTIARIEKGYPCRLETMRRIILALGYPLSEKNKIFLGE